MDNQLVAELTFEYLITLKFAAIFKPEYLKGIEIAKY